MLGMDGGRGVCYGGRCHERGGVVVIDSEDLQKRMGESNVETNQALNLLLAKATAGDKEALAAVYQAYFIPVFRFVLKRVQNKETAEDISQTVFIKTRMATTPWEFRTTPPLAYLFTIARNAITDHWRKAKKYATVPLNEVQDVKSPEKLGERAEASDAVWDGLAALDEIQRRVVVMKCVEGFSTAEIASALHTTESNVRQLQCRAFKKLKAKLS